MTTTIPPTDDTTVLLEDLQAAAGTNARMSGKAFEHHSPVDAAKIAQAHAAAALSLTQATVTLLNKDQRRSR